MPPSPPAPLIARTRAEVSVHDQVEQVLGLLRLLGQLAPRDAHVIILTRRDQPVSGIACERCRHAVADRTPTSRPGNPLADYYFRGPGRCKAGRVDLTVFVGHQVGPGVRLVAASCAVALRAKVRTRTGEESD